MFSPRSFDSFSPEGGCSEDLDAFRFFLKHRKTASIVIYYTILYSNLLYSTLLYYTLRKDHNNSYYNIVIHIAAYNYHACCGSQSNNEHNNFVILFLIE